MIDNSDDDVTRGLFSVLFQPVLSNFYAKQNHAVVVENFKNFIVSGFLDNLDERRKDLLVSGFKLLWREPDFNHYEVRYLRCYQFLLSNFVLSYLLYT